MDFISLMNVYGVNVVGFAMPFVVELINRDIKNEKLKFGVSFIICTVVAVLMKLPDITSGSLENLLASLAIVFTESQVVFKLYFSTSSLRASLQRPATK